MEVGAVRRKLWLCACGLSLSVFCAVFAVYAAEETKEILASPEISEALVEDNWGRVFTLIAGVGDNSLSSNAILLQGHAALATDRHNAAAALFVLIGDTTAFEDWRLWTEHFHKQHPDVAASRYLVGDAYAREGKFDQALSYFNSAIEISPDHFLTKNARGVTNAILYAAKAEDKEAAEQHYHHISSAINDFADVREVNPGFIDAVINQGIASIETYRFSGARVFFNEAVEMDSSSALALNGRAMLFLEEGKRDQAEADIIRADSLLPNFPLILWNAKALADSSDTTSVIGRMANLRGKDAILDTSRGSFTIDVPEFVDGLDHALGGMFDQIGLGGAYDFGKGLGEMWAAVDFQFGGVYFDVQKRGGSHRVGTNYALAYPRPIQVEAVGK
ncbi:MAG: tetratricopeptide repeat protein [Candidatus Eisenbacteria bacterium]